MSTIREYVKNNIGWKVEYDNNGYNYQCVDLAKDFVNQVYWESVGSIWNAHENYIKLSSYWFSSIDYNWDNRPKRWDIISFEKNAGNWYAWHVAICLAYDELSKDVYVLEQNWWRNSSTWTWSDAIRIVKRPFSSMLWWARYNDDSVIQNDLFDKVVNKKWIYIWEATNYLNKEDVAFKAFYFLAWYKDYLNWKRYDSIWWRGNWACTRQDLAIMIYKFIKVVLSRSVTPAEIIRKWIWNWRNANSNLTWEEFTFMINKTKEVYWL